MKVLQSLPLSVNIGQEFLWPFNADSYHELPGPQASLICLVLQLLSSFINQLLHSLAFQNIVDTFTSDPVGLPNKSLYMIIHVFYIDSVIEL